MRNTITKKCLFFCTLLALSLVALPKTAYAETYTLLIAPTLRYGVTSDSSQFAGIWLDTTDGPQWWNQGTGWAGIDETSTTPEDNVYDIFKGGTIPEIISVNETTGNVSVILTNDRTGEFNLGTISINGETPGHTLYGFQYMGPDSFTGTINGDNVTVTSSAGNAAGFAFAGDVAGTLKAGTITVTGDETYGVRISGNATGGTIETGNIKATGSNASGGGAGAFVVWGDEASAATVTLGTLEASGNWALGAQLIGGATGDITTGTITVTAQNGDAHGLLAGHLADLADLKKVTVGAITVDGKAGVYGVRANEIEELILAGNINATGTTGDTIGISVHTVTKVTGTASRTIFATTTGSDSGRAMGINIGDTAGGITIGSSGTTIGFTANSASNDAFGIALLEGLAGTSSTKATIDYFGNASATSTTGLAAGIYVNKQMSEATLNATGSLSGTSTSGHASGLFVNSAMTNSTAEIAGGLSATSSSGHATGIAVKGDMTDSTVKVTGTSNNVTATSTSTGGGASGIYVDGDMTDSTVDVAGNVSGTSTYGNVGAIEIAGGLLGESTVKVGGTVTATLNSNSAEGRATGVIVTGNIESDSTLETGNVSAVRGTALSESESNSGMFRGIRIEGNVDGDVKVGDVTTNATNSTDNAGGPTDLATAVSLEIEGNFTGNVALGAVTASANRGDATGIKLGGTANTGTMTLKGITASTTGDTASAQGLYSASNADLNLKSDNDINLFAQGKGANTVGIRTAGDAEMTITSEKKKGGDGDDKDDIVPITVNIMGRREIQIPDPDDPEETKTDYEYMDIWTGGNLTIDLAKNNLNTRNVKVDGSRLEITGGGKATLGTVSMPNGNLIIGDGHDVYEGEGEDRKLITTTAGIDFTKDKTNLGTANELHSNGVLEVTGASGYAKGETMAIFTVNNGELDPGNYKVQFEQAGNAWNLIYGGLGRISDARLAALSLHNRNAAWNSVRDRMISGSDWMRECYEVRSYRGQRNDSRALYSVNGGDARAWVNYVGRYDTQWSPYHDKNWKLTMDGIQVGTDLWRTQNEQLGILFGYEGGKAVNSGDRVKVDDPYVGVYGARMLYGGADIRGLFAYGWQKYNMYRMDGNTRYRTRFQGNTAETHLEIGRRVSAGPWSTRPVLGVDVFTNDLKSAWEGGDSDIYYGKTNLTQVLLRVGSDVRLQRGAFTYNGGLYYSYDVATNAGKRLSAKVWEWDDSANDGYGGLDPVTCTGSKLGRSLLSFHAGGEWQVSSCFSIIGGYHGEHAFDRTRGEVQHTGYAGGAWQW